MKRRDEQVYAAEAAVRDQIQSAAFPSIQSAQTWLDHVIEVEHRERRRRLVEVRVTRSPGQDFASCLFKGRLMGKVDLFEIILPRRYRTAHFALHELAHAYTWHVEDEDHGPKFCRENIRLARRWLSAEAADMLAKKYEAKSLLNRSRC